MTIGQTVFCTKIEYSCDSKLHREDGPAYIAYGEEFGYIEKWYFNGSLHRLNGPACIDIDVLRHEMVCATFIHGKYTGHKRIDI